jgi:hypothetical protein
MLGPMPAALYRQGDVLLGAVDAIPVEARRLRRLVLASGDATGQRHVLRAARGVRLLEHRGQLFIDVDADGASVVHPEHGTIELPRGRYRVWRQREWLGGTRREVVD